MKNEINTEKKYFSLLKIFLHRYFIKYGKIVVLMGLIRVKNWEVDFGIFKFIDINRTIEMFIIIVIYI